MVAGLEGFTGPKAPMPDVDIVTFVYEGGEKDWDKPIYFDATNHNRFYTKNTASKLIRQLIAGLRKHGMKQGDCILVNSFNDINYTPLVQAIVGAGGVFTGANPAYTPTELAHQFAVANVSFIFTEPEQADATVRAASVAGIPPSHIFILNNLPEQKCLKGMQLWTTLLQHGEQDWVRLKGHATLASTTACRLMSSGTTGPSKAVNITHANLLAQYMGVVPPNKCPYERRFVFSTPVFHAAMVPQMHFYHFRDGRAVYLFRRFDLAKTLDMVGEVRATELILVPAMVIMILADMDEAAKQGKGKRYDLSSLRAVLVGSAPMDKSIQASFRGLLEPGTRVVQGWGMSEMCCTGTQFDYPEDDDTGSVGRPIPGIDFALLDEEGKVFRKYDTKGELLVRGEMVTRGYQANPKANAEAFMKGEDGVEWFRTGDICVCDAKTKLWYIVGREKELIKVRAMQVAPAEIEAVLITHPEIVDAAVIGVDWAKGLGGSDVSEKEERRRQASGELIRAYVIPRGGVKNAKVTESELIEFAAKRLASYKRITAGLIFVDEIPKNAYGKILRPVLKKQFLEKQKAAQAVKARL